jgi:hypothetical protein
LTCVFFKQPKHLSCSDWLRPVVASTQLLQDALAANGVVVASTHCKHDCVLPGISHELKHAAHPVDSKDGNRAALMQVKHRACVAAVVGMLPQSKHSCCTFGLV